MQGHDRGLTRGIGRGYRGHGSSGSPRKGHESSPPRLSIQVVNLGVDNIEVTEGKEKQVN